MKDTVETLSQQLQKLRSLHAQGVIGDAKFAESSAALERRLVELVLATPASTGQAGQAPATVASAPPPRVGGRMAVALGALVVLLAAAGYWWTGDPQAMGPPPEGFAGAGGAESPSDAATGPAHEVSKEQILAMAERLAARLKDKPDDAEGWRMLGRSYMAVGQPVEALAAYERVAKLMPDDAGALADHADALAVRNNRELKGEPTRLIERALKLDPDNLKALVLAGTAAFNRGDFAAAVVHWDRAATVGGPDNPMTQQARDAAAEAREAGKLPPAAATPGDKGTVAAAEPAAPAAAPDSAAAAAATAITGTVTLAPALKGKVSADDAVFIFARAAEGSRMPLALVRKQVKDLPYTFQLDDSQAMSPASRLSTASSVVVGARISKSGQAMPQPGDLEGLTAATAVGSKGVAVVIAGEVGAAAAPAR